MAENEKDGKPKTPRNDDPLSEELVNQIKEEILFGTGYRKPPKETQFRKGQSGNPAGRPKRPDLASAIAARSTCSPQGRRAADQHTRWRCR